jgi:DNA-binding transcriptional ArsR family regulator
MVMVDIGEEKLDAVFGALADSTRRAILARLTRGEATVAELVAPFDMSQPAISRHLKVLERAGLITRTRRATARLSHLRAEPLHEANTWLTEYRAFWEESYERLDEVLATLQADETDRSSDPAPGSDPTGRSTT